ncbi:hypothetical protein LEL_07756 [Akanthomyces lecanii RCEF 1005]|uniref:LPXTG-domain-containing protein n=1 Tax=Akanthomyces lecanii RCEF 1005 TaxID=1081108 RepID=A0A162KJC8_CORDF|nr:hypothetical protein LEL_07756 [Akanthomyces lecanii RCEF 1005]
MAMHRLWKATAAFLFVFSSSTADALQVTPGSKCAKACLNAGSDNPWKASDSNTNITDVTCSDSKYLDTAAGQHYQRCLTCLQRSDRVWDGETDLKWFVYNLRYTLDACLFSIPSTPIDDSNISCSTNGACRSLKTSLSNDDLEPNPNKAWDYCAADDGNFMSQNQSSCRDCLRNSKEQAYMANFITALEAGCRQTPNDGDVLGLSATVFSKTTVDIIDPERVTNPDEPSGKLPAPAIAGIVVGVVLVCTIAVCLLIAHCRRERRHGSWSDPYDSEPQHSPYRSPTGYGAGSKGHFVRPYRGDQAYAGGGGGSSRGNSEKTTPVTATQHTGSRFPNGGIELRSTPVHYEHDLKGYRQRSQTSIATPAPTYAGGENNQHDDDDARRGRTPPRKPSRDDGYYFGERGGDYKSPPQPPASVSLGLPANPRRRSNTPDSFAEQAYMAAAEESERIAERHAAASRASQHLSPIPSSPGDATSNRDSHNGRLLAALLPTSITSKLKVPSLFRSSSPRRPIRNISAPILATEPRYSIAPRGPVIVDPQRQKRVSPRAVRNASDVYG